MTKRAENFAITGWVICFGRDTRIALFFGSSAVSTLWAMLGSTYLYVSPRPYFIGWNFTEGHESIHLFIVFSSIGLIISIYHYGYKSGVLTVYCSELWTSFLYWNLHWLIRLYFHTISRRHCIFTDFSNQHLRIQTIKRSVTMKKILIFGGLVIVLFIGIVLLTNMATSEKVEGNHMEKIITSRTDKLWIMNIIKTLLLQTN